MTLLHGQNLKFFFAWIVKAKWIYGQMKKKVDALFCKTIFERPIKMAGKPYYDALLKKAFINIINAATTVRQQGVHPMYPDLTDLGNLWAPIRKRL